MKKIIGKTFLMLIATLGVVGLCYLIYSELSLRAYDVLVLISIGAYLELLFMTMITIPSGKNISSGEGGLVDLAIKLRDTWMRSYLIWFGIYYLFTWMPLLISCIVIYLSGSGIESGNIDGNRVLIYSILSLSLGFLNLLVKPATMAKGYRKAYVEVIGSIQKYQLELIQEEKLICRRRPVLS